MPLSVSAMRAKTCCGKLLNLHLCKVRGLWLASVEAFPSPVASDGPEAPRHQRPSAPLVGLGFGFAVVTGGVIDSGIMRKLIISHSRSASDLFSTSVGKLIMSSVIDRSFESGWLQQPDLTGEHR